MRPLDFWQDFFPLNVQIQFIVEDRDLAKKSVHWTLCHYGTMQKWASQRGTTNNWSNIKHLKSQQKSRPDWKIIVEAPEEGRKEASPFHRTTHVCVFFSDSIFSFGTLLNIPKPVAVVCIQPHKNLVEKSDVRSHHPTRYFLLGFLASTYIAGLKIKWRKRRLPIV